MKEGCESVRGHLLDMVDGNLDPNVDNWLRAHLAECAACSRELQDLRDVVAGLPDGRLEGPPKYARRSVLRYARGWTPAVQDGGVGRRGFSGQWLAVAGIVGALIAAMMFGLRNQPERSPAALGVTAPGFTATNVATGDTLTLEDYRGNVVLLNIWATWCLPCESEMASMDRLYKEFAGRGLRVVAVSIDQAHSSVVRDWVLERNFTFEVLHDRSRLIERQFQTVGVPETFVIDRNGTIVNRHIGPAQWDDLEHQEFMRNLLGADE